VRGAPTPARTQTRRRPDNRHSGGALRAPHPSRGVHSLNHSRKRKREHVHYFSLSRTSPRGRVVGRGGRQTAVVGGIQCRPTHAVLSFPQEAPVRHSIIGRVLREADHRDPTLVADGRIMCRSRFLLWGSDVSPPPARVDPRRSAPRGACPTRPPRAPRRRAGSVPR
jgi:hypothetical protein